MPDSNEPPPEASARRTSRSQLLSQANSPARARKSNPGTHHDIASSLFSGYAGDLEELFLAAARDGDYDRIQNFLQRRGDILVSVDVKDKRTGNTPLIWAAKRGHSKIVQLLLRHGADVTLRNYDNRTALEVASPAIKQVLLDSIHRTGSSHQHLLQAAWQGNIELVRKLMSDSKALDIDCRNSDGLTPLLLVTRDVYLFEKLGTQLVSSYDPLHVVQELISHRADVNATDSEGRTPLHYASLSKSLSANELADVMLTDGSNVDLRDKRCSTPLHCASQSGNVEVVLALLHHGSDPNCRGFAGATPLHITAYNGHERVAMALLENGADVTLVDDSGRTPLDIAVSKKVRSTLKQAWVQATQVKKEAEMSLAPIRNATKTGGRKSAKKKGGEVIFDGDNRRYWTLVYQSIEHRATNWDESLVRSKSSPRPLPKKLTPLNHEASSPAILPSDAISAEWDALNVTKPPSREGPRRLGEPRGRPPLQPKLTNTPEKLQTKYSDHSLTPLTERPVSRNLFNRSASDLTNERENPHQRLAFRKSDPVRKFAATPSGDSQIEVTIVGLDRDESRGGASAMRRHSEPQNTSFSDLAASCDDMLAKVRNSVFTPERSDSSSPPPRLTPLRTPSGSDRRRMKIPDTIDENKVSSSKPVILDLDQMRLTQQSGSPLFIDYSALYPGRRIIPPTPTSQGRVSSTRLIDLSSDFGSREQSPEDSSKDSSPRSDVVSPPHMVIHKENFNIEETRISENPTSNRSSINSSVSDLTTPSPVNADTPRRLSLPPMGSPEKSASGISPKISPKAVASSARVVNRKIPEKATEKSSGKAENVKSPEKNIEKAKNLAVKSAGVVSTKVPKVSSPHSGGRKEPGGKSIEQVSASQVARLRAQAKVNAVNRLANSSRAKVSDGKISLTPTAGASEDMASATENVNVSSPPKNKVTVHSNFFVTEMPDKSLDFGNLSVSVNQGAGLTVQAAKAETVTGQVLASTFSPACQQTPGTSSRSSTVKTSKEVTTNSQPSAKDVNNTTKTTSRSPRESQKDVPTLKRQISSTSVASFTGGSYPVKMSPEKNTRLTKVSSTIISDHSVNTNPTRTGALRGSTTPRKPQQRSPSKTLNKDPGLSMLGNAGENEPGRGKVVPNSIKIHPPDVSAKETTNKNAVCEDQKLTSEVTGSCESTGTSANTETVFDQKNSSKTMKKDSSKISVNAKVSDLSTEEILDPFVSSRTKQSVENTIKESQQTRALIDESFQTFAQAYIEPPSPSKSPKKSTDILLHAIEMLENVNKELDKEERLTPRKTVAKEELVVKKNDGEPSNVQKTESKSKMSPSKPVQKDVRRNTASMDKKASSKTNQVSPIRDPNKADLSKNKVDNNKKMATSGSPVKLTTKSMAVSEESQTSKLDDSKLTSCHKSDSKTSKLTTNSSTGAPCSTDNKDVKYASATLSGTSAKVDTKPVSSPPNKQSESNSRPSKLVKKSSSVDEIAKDIKKAVTEKKALDRKTVKTEANNSVKPSASSNVSKVEPKPSNISPRKTKTTLSRTSQSGAKVESGYLTQSDNVKVEGKNGQINPEELTPLDSNKVPMVVYAGGSKELAKTVNINFLEHTGPVIEDVFENFPQPVDLTFNNNQATPASEPSSKGKTAGSQKPVTFQFTGSSKSRIKSSAKRSVKDKDLVEQRNTSSNKNVSGKNSPENKSKKGVTDRKRRNVKKRKKKGQGQIYISERANSPTNALISGIGWHIETHCNDKSDVIAVGLADSTDDETDSEKKPAERSQSARSDAEMKLNAINKLLDSDSSLKGTEQVKRKVLSADRKEAIREMLKRYHEFGDQNLIPQTLHAIKEFSKQVQDSDLSHLLGLDQSGDSLHTDSYCSYVFGDDSVDSIKQSAVRQSFQHGEPVKESARMENIGVGEQHFPLRESDDDYVPMSEHDSEFSVSADSSRQSSGQSKLGSGKTAFIDQLRELRDSNSGVREVTEESMDTSRNSVREQNPPAGLSHDVTARGSERIIEQNLTAAPTDASSVLPDSTNAVHSKEKFVRSLSDTWTTSADSKPFKEKTFVELKNTPTSPQQVSSDRKSPSKTEVADANSSYNETNPEFMQVHHPSDIFEKLYMKPSMDDAASVSLVPQPSKQEPVVSKNIAGLPPRPKSSKPPSIRSQANFRPQINHHKGNFAEVKVEDGVREKDMDEMSDHPSLANSEALSEMFSVAEDVDENVLTQQAVVQVMDSPESRMYTSRLGRKSSSRVGSACTQDSDGDKIIEWKKGNMLGKGAYGMVWCGLTNDGELIAVKQIDLNIHNWEKAEQEYDKIQEEVDLLKTLKHKNIVGFLGTSLDDSVVSIFMQFVPGGSIATVLARFGALDETVFWKYTKQILEGVVYIHANDVIHRDIKGGNIMLMPNGVIKLIDFGCAKRLCLQLSASQSKILKSMRGTPYWMAPEVIMETGHGKKSDIWSIGCTVFEMATRKPPWSDMSAMAAIFAIGQGTTPVPQLSEKFSEEARGFVSTCLTRDQNQRPSASELLEHPFITKRKHSTS